ncbi:MAG: arsinothricin resistance N-acetyltransferase ArsN1 family B [Acidimicrobiales bacterium]
MYIRMATEADAPGVGAVYGPIVESTAISFELVVPYIAEMAERIAARQPTYPFLVLEEAGSVAGYAYAGRFSSRSAYDWSVESSVYVAEWARGRGVGKALYVALFEILAHQGCRRVMAGIALPNPASVALHEGVGFTPVGVYRAVGWKFGAWHDVGWWQRGWARQRCRQGPGSLHRPPRRLLEAAFEAGHRSLG